MTWNFSSFLKFCIGTRLSSTESQPKKGVVVVVVVFLDDIVVGHVVVVIVGHRNLTLKFGQ